MLIELKRNQTPRDVIAQALDYAGWVSALEAEDIRLIYTRYKPGRNLAEDFRNFHGTALVEEDINQHHQIVVVAASLDSSTERIVNYLTSREVPINVLFFQTFMLGADQILSRSWLVDPSETQANSIASAEKITEPWNGEYYCSFGDHEGSRSWEDAVRFGFISAGGGAWYSRTLNVLKPGDRVWVNIPRKGYVGVGRVLGRPILASDFLVETASGEVSLGEAGMEGSYHLHDDDPSKWEYFVPIRWLQTRRKSEAIQEIGFFGNQNSICAPTAPKWRSTVERLKAFFPKFNDDSASF